MEGEQSDCYPRRDAIIARGAEQGLGKDVLFHVVNLWPHHARFTTFTQ